MPSSATALARQLSERVLDKFAAEKFDGAEGDEALNPDRELLWRTWFSAVSWWFRLWFGEQPSEFVRTGLSLLFFVTSTYLMCFANLLTEKRNLDTFAKFHGVELRQQVLPDVGFDAADLFFPWLSTDPTWLSLPDTGQMALAVFFLLWIIFDCRSPYIATRRFLVVHAIMFLGRGICLICTQLPNPYSGYAKFEFNDTPVVGLFLDALCLITRQKVSTTDVFFSGHTVSMTLMCLAIEYYSPRNRRLVISLCWIFCIFILAVIIGTKFHYSIDVVIAFCLTLLLWKVYHMTINDEAMRNAFPVIGYFEGPIQDHSYSRLPNPDEIRSLVEETMREFEESIEKRKRKLTAH